MSYPSSLTDPQWSLIEGYFSHGKYGNMSRYAKRQLVDGILYVTKTGCQWRQRPREFPPWQTVYSFFRRAKNSGIWEQVLRDLVEKSRIRMGRNPLPTYSIIDSQSVKTTSACEERGIDGGKKVKGRKRHIVTETQGHLLHVKVHADNTHDTVAGCQVFQETLDKYPSLEGVSADDGYRKTMENFATEVLGKTIEISKRIKNEWAILAKRWVVERTFAWLNPFRRLAKDVEISISSAEAFVRIAHSMVLIQRLGVIS